MRRLLKWLWVIQKRSIIDPLGRGQTQRRLNPFNPLTYLVILVSLIVGLVLFGLVGLKDEVNWDELKFKWL
jgi:hypothetical protein